MSKMDNLRAMREARYEESQARARTAAGATAAARPVPAGKAQSSTTRAERSATLAVVPDLPEPESGPEAQPEAEPAPALCGHRNMGGRTCTREAGHAAKSHRYS